MTLRLVSLVVLFPASSRRHSLSFPFVIQKWLSVNKIVFRLLVLLFLTVSQLVILSLAFLLRIQPELNPSIPSFQVHC